MLWKREVAVVPDRDRRNFFSGLVELNRRPCRTDTDFLTARDDSTNDAWLSRTVVGPCPGQPPLPALISYFWQKFSPDFADAQCRLSLPDDMGTGKEHERKKPLSDKSGRGFLREV